MNTKELINKLDPNKVKCWACETYSNKEMMRRVRWLDKDIAWACKNSIHCDGLRRKTKGHIL